MQSIAIWIAQSLCKNMSKPDATFFPSVGARSRLAAMNARLICSMCPVQQDCLDYAVAHNEEGFWGGKTEAERASLPAFITEYIKSEYERLGLLEPRQNIDALIAAERIRLAEERSLAAESSSLYNVLPPL